MHAPRKNCRLVILISGRGSNMENIVQVIAQRNLPAEVCAVIANKADAQGIQWAQRQGIATQVVAHKDYATREQFDNALAHTVAEYRPDYVLLAGFMRVLTPAFIDPFAGQIINIHPSLLPLFPGLDTHQKALEAGLQWHGCTVHFVTAELDSGPTIAQGVVPIHQGDDAKQLAARLLPIEHKTYAQVVEWLAFDLVQIDPSGKVNVLGVNHRGVI
ncbi:MAG TPA: phosphoribosylglycinamide formyltransferase [Paenalcaligenes sp.]|nr:phosphoribosylglycinamide formyltransferase [Paenalcaligenes sp.]